MKPPKNFYSNLDRRKQGLPELPEASASDAGKIIKVGEDGEYELGVDQGLPPIEDNDSTKLLQITSGNWNKTSTPLTRAYITTNTSGYISSTQDSGCYINITDSTITRYVLGQTASHSALLGFNSNRNLMANIVINSIKYSGFLSTVLNQNAIFYCVDASNNPYMIAIGASSYSVTPIGSIKYYEITASGSSVSLPSGVTFADVYAELQAGVDVKFTSGSRVYSVTSFESTNIRAHWISDLDLTSIEVYVINLASDGTGTVASATFSGS